MGIELIVLTVYGLGLTFILLYSLVQIQLVYNYLTKKTEKDRIKDEFRLKSNPNVTVQLPVYNEKYVVERLIRAVSQFQYPKDKFEIQVLDDSDDETSEIIQNLVGELKAEGIDIVHLQREVREGFKAGALAHGLKTAKGEFIAIFDADFIPRPDFLEKTIPHFSEASVGMVQTKWEHVNENYSWLTKLQAFGLDAHFSVEQEGRNAGGHFINFNGTAGIWRKSCINDAGGWQSDTLTEDLDLSYRAQMKGWRFKYLEDCGAPAELPAHIHALKTQQYRWTKGAAECSRKNLMSLIRSGDFKLSTKINGIFHLLNSSLFISIFLISVLSVPVLYIKHEFNEYAMLYNGAVVFVFSVIFLFVFYLVSFTHKFDRSIWSILKFIFRFPFFLAVSMGLSLHNGIAAFEGLIGRKSPFIRTPKFNIIEKNDSWKSKNYASLKIGRQTYLELLLAFYFGSGLVLSFKLGDFGLFPIFLLLTIGFFFVSFLSLKHALSN